MKVLRTLWQLFAIFWTVIGYSFLGIAFWCVDVKREYRLFYKYGYRFAQTVLDIGGVRLEVEGREHLEAGKQYVFVANHVSIADIPAIWTAVGDMTNIRIVYKKELRHIPVFGWVLMCSPFIAVKRDKPRDGMKSINAAIEAAQRGSSVVIFAEGTRSRTGRLLPFKRGAFMLAARAHKPLVPVAIIGSQKIMREGEFRIYPELIRVVIGKPIEPPSEDNRQSEKILMEELYYTVCAMLPPEMQPL